MQNYFDYFSEIEQRFTQRRGSLLLLSTLDWALIESWREAGVPLEAVLRGIDDAFDKYEARAARSPGRLRKVNGLAWCAQSVMHAAEAAVDASTGAPVERAAPEDSGFEAERIAAYLQRNAATLENADPAEPARTQLQQIAARLRELAESITAAPGTLNTETLEQSLTALEERLFSALMLSAEETEVVALREQVARELAASKSRMTAVQIRQVTQQFVHKRLLQARGLPRLSLFYMEMA